MTVRPTTPQRALAAFADRIKLISQPNGGVSAARNAGLLAATGEFVQFLDSDNLLDAEHIEEKVRAFASIADADLCYCKPTDVSLFGVRSSFRLGQAYRFREAMCRPRSIFSIQSWRMATRSW